jgi:hypothetical protein
MKQYGILIDAQLDGCKSEMVLYSETSDTCKFSPRFRFYDWLCRNFPLIDWVPDDGDDFDDDPNTDYCQYVSYCDPDSNDSYVLAAFNVTEEEDK